MKEQRVVWVSGSGASVQIGKKCPSKVWTLCLERKLEKVPKLPINPVHGFNAFREDLMHDWSYTTNQGGWLRYFSRLIEDEGIWILLEFGEDD